MDIKNLIAFIEVSERRSFSRTAESLNLTQPAVSKRIAALETELSARLFDRVGRNVFLTEAGNTLLPHARQISASIACVEDAIKNLGQEAFGKLTIGTSHHVGVHYLASVLKHLRTSHPDIELDIQFDNTQNTISAVRNCLLEIALCTMHGTVPEGLKEFKVWTENLLVVVAPSHPLATINNIDAESLMKFAVVLPSAPSALRTKIDHVLTTQNLRANEVIGTTNHESMKMMISIGLGWGCLPEKIVGDSLVILDIPQLKFTQRISLIKNKDRTLSSVTNLFIDQFLNPQST